jgi:HK97 family phage major capsid protein
MKGSLTMDYEKRRRLARMREDRAQRLDEMRKITGLAEEQRRELTHDEARKWDRLEGEIGELTAKIDELAAADPNLQSRMTRSVIHGGVQDFTTPGGADDRGSGTLGEWFAGESRALAEGSGSGSYIVPEEYLPRVWDRLAAESVGLQSGFTVLETETDTLHVPKLTADAAAAWVAEAATISATDPTLSENIATPRKLAVLTQVSNELIADSNPRVLDVLFRNIFRSLGLKLDLGFYEGSGSAPEIRGLKNVSGIQSVSMGTNGAALTNLDPFADAIGLLEGENAEATAIVMHPRSWGALLKLKEQTSGNNKPLLQESAGSGSQGVDRRLYGVPVFLTSQLSITETQGSASNASSAYVYEAEEVIAVRRQEARVEVDRSRLFNTDQSEVRGILRWDVVVPNAKAICRIAGIIP